MFALFLFIIDKGFYYFLYEAPKLEYDTRLEKVIKGEVNKELIILGSSRGAGNIIAGQIQKETKLTSYNLSYPGSDVLFHEFLLKSLLKFNHKPKKIIFSIDNPTEFLNEKSLLFRFDRLYPLSKYNYINKELVDRKERNVLSWLFCLGRLNKNSFALQQISAPNENPILPCGSMPFIKKLPNAKLTFSNSIEKYDTKKELSEKLQAFKNIQNSCKENNIQLIFVFSPNYKTFNANFEKRFRKLMLPENKIVVYDQTNPIYKKENYYFDVSHLMKNGATIFTNEIVAFIKKN